MKRSLVVAVAALLLAAPVALAEGLAAKKVLVLHSYHAGFEWTDTIEASVRKVLQGSGVQVHTHWMDTKRHPEEKFRKEAGLAARALIERLRPDLVITSDDNAVSYVLVPYFKNAALPFVFCGVNWDASGHGLPFRNTTGMLEVALAPQLVGQLREYARGPRIGYLTADSETERTEHGWFTQQMKLPFAEARLVKTFAEWKEAFLRMQEKADLLLLGNYAGINDWDAAEASAFVLAHGRIPSGGMYDYMMPYAMLGFAKLAEEQGSWAATTALRILKGAAPASIPVVPNREGKVLLNVRLASKAGVVFKPELVRSAQVVH